MSYLIQDISFRLKAARERKGLTQRALAKQAGVPQGHISRIENGTVDLRLSSLIALARVLDLELALVPRKALPAVQSIVRGIENSETSQKAHDMNEDIYLYFDSSKNTKDSKDIKDEVLKSLRKDSKALKKLMSFQSSTDPYRLKRIEQQIARFEEVRNAIVHAPADTVNIDGMRPAYSLDEDDDV